MASHHPVDQRQLVGEVGDHRGGVRQPVQRGERRAALEVDQHEVERLGGVGGGQPEHQRAQQLRLAGAGGADEQAVRAHAVLRGLLEVQLDRAAVGADADRHPQPVAVGAAAPSRARRSKCSGSAMPSSSARPISVASGASEAFDGRGQPQRGQPAGHRLGLHDGRAGRPRRPRPARPSSRCAAGGRRRSPAPACDRSSRRGGGASRSRMVTAVDAARRWPGAPAPVRSPPSSTTTTCGAVRWPAPAGLNRGRLAITSSSSSSSSAAELATSRTGPSASAAGGVLGVRQPLHPLPARPAAPGRRRPRPAGRPGRGRRPAG